MTSPVISADQHEKAQAAEARFLKDALWEASLRDDDEFERRLNELLASPGMLARVQTELKADCDLLWAQAAREQRGSSHSHADTRPASFGLQWALGKLHRGLAAGLVVAIVGVPLTLMAVNTKVKDLEVVSRSSRQSEKLPDDTVMTADPYTSAHVNFTLLARNIDLDAGGLNLHVAHEMRPFNVNTSRGTATAVGTRFYMRLEGPTDAQSLLIQVTEGTVNFQGRQGGGARDPAFFTLHANQSARIAPDGSWKQDEFSPGTQEPAALTELRNEPLARLAARFRQGSGMTIVVARSACGYPVSGDVDLTDPSAFADIVTRDPNLRVRQLVDGGLFVADAADRSSVQDALKNRCDVDAPADVSQ